MTTLSLIKLHILDPEAGVLHLPQAGTMKQLCHEQVRPAQAQEQPLLLVTGQENGRTGLF